LTVTRREYRFHAPESQKIKLIQEKQVVLRARSPASAKSSAGNRRFPTREPGCGPRRVTTYNVVTPLRTLMATASHGTYLISSISRYLGRGQSRSATIVWRAIIRDRRVRCQTWGEKKSARDHGLKFESVMVP
jgi:hypothetical protein